jgi:hypothetical protein
VSETSARTLRTLFFYFGKWKGGLKGGKGNPPSSLARYPTFKPVKSDKPPFRVSMTGQSATGSRSSSPPSTNPASQPPT